MTDENSSLPGEETVEVNQTEMFHATPEGQATLPNATDGQETVNDDATIVKPAATTTPKNADALALADQPTLFIPPLATETDRPGTADGQTLVQPMATSPEPIGIAMLPTQAIIPTDITPEQIAGNYPQTDPYAQPGYQQSGMPLQPGQMGAPAAPKKRRTALWITLIILAIFLIGGGTALALVASQQPTNTPTQVLQQFCDGYTTLDAQKIYNTMSKSSQNSTSLTQLQQSLGELKSLGSFAKFSSCTVSNVKQNGATATGTITLTMTVSFDTITSTSSIPISMGLVLENNAWKIDMSKMGSNFNSMQGMPTLPPNFFTPTVPGSTNQ